MATDEEVRGVSMGNRQDEAIARIGGSKGIQTMLIGRHANFANLGVKITDIDVDYGTRTVYIADTIGSRKGVTRINLDSGLSKSIFDDEAALVKSSVYSVAVDWINRN